MSDTLRWATELDASGFASGAQRVNSTLGQMGIQTNAATMQMGGLGTVMGAMANPLTMVALGATAVGAALVGSVQAAAAWQSSMAGVSKTTGMTGDDLKGLSKDLLDMSARMPAAASEIANVAQVAGSLGIVKDEIVGFTEVAIQMGVGFEMSAEQAATSGAKILTAYNLDVTKENMLALGNTVNAMGDNFAATEPQVLDFVNRASFLNTTMGQTIPNIAALGTVMISAGMDADLAATGLKSFLNMATSERSKTGGLDNWAKLLNVSVDQLKTNLAGDFNATLIETANQIAGLADPVERFQTAVKLAGTEGAPALLKLAGQQDELRKALGLSNEEWEHGQSLQKTYGAQLETFNSQMQIMGNVLNMAGVELGTVFLPALTSGVKTLTDMTMGAIETGRAIYGVIDAWNKWVAAGVGKYAEMETKYETENKGHWQLVGDDAIWIADQIADGVEAGVNEGMKRGDEAFQAGVDAGMWDESGKAIGGALGKNAADAFGNEFIAQMRLSSLTDQALLAMINSQSTSANKAIDTTFDYLDQKYNMTMSKGGSGWYYSLFGKDGLIGQSTALGDYKKMDPATAFEEITGFPAPGEGTEAYFRMLGDNINAEKIALANSIKSEPINLWEQADSTRSWMKFTDENKELAKVAGDEIIYELYNAQTKALEANDPTLQESLGNVMKGLLEPGSVPEQIFNQSLADIIDAGYVSAGHKTAMEEIAKADAEGYKSALFGAMKSEGETRTLAEIISSGGSGIADISAWMENEFGPKLNSEMESMNKLWDSGLTDNRKIVEEDLNLLKTTFEDHGNWFSDWQQDLIEIYKSGDITTNQFLDKWGEYAKKAEDSASKASEVVKSANALFYEEIRDDTKTWHDYMNSEGGFVGPTKDWYAMKIDQQKEINEIARLKAEYESMGGESPIGIGSINQELEMAVSMDTTAAMSATDELVASIRATEPDMVLSLDTNAAYTAWGHLVQDIEATRPVMQVQLRVSADASQIRAAVRAEIASAVSGL